MPSLRDTICIIQGETGEQFSICFEYFDEDECKHLPLDLTDQTLWLCMRNICTGDFFKFEGKNLEPLTGCVAFCFDTTDLLCGDYCAEFERTDPNGEVKIHTPGDRHAYLIKIKKRI